MSEHRPTAIENGPAAAGLSNPSTPQTPAPAPQTAQHSGGQVVSGAALRAKARPFITNPETGNTYQVKRPSLTAMIKSGVLPENFVAKSLTSLARREEDDAELTDRDILNSEAVRRATVTYALLNPRVVENAQAEDEVEYDDIPTADRDYIHAWVDGTLESATVETGDGEVTQGELATFPPVERQGEPDRPDGDGALLS